MCFIPKNMEDSLQINSIKTPIVQQKSPPPNVRLKPLKRATSMTRCRLKLNKKRFDKSTQICKPSLLKPKEFQLNFKGSKLRTKISIDKLQKQQKTDRKLLFSYCATPMQKAPAIEYSISSQKLKKQLSDAKIQDPKLKMTPMISRNSFLPQSFRTTFYNGKRRERKGKHGYKLPNFKTHKNESGATKIHDFVNQSLESLSKQYSQEEYPGSIENDPETLIFLDDKYELINRPIIARKRPGSKCHNTIQTDKTSKKILKSSKSQACSLSILRNNHETKLHKKGFSPSKKLARKNIVIQTDFKASSTNSQSGSKEVVLNFINQKPNVNRSDSKAMKLMQSMPETASTARNKPFITLKRALISRQRNDLGFLSRFYTYNDNCYDEGKATGDQRDEIRTLFSNKSLRSVSFNNL
ncbi:unnamed protein product [Moneuplotes crassus]|uniref:Uncharacterized protein n=1 Tax=Euplotes crassus TaxID=5936 RepID=A0AAD1UIS1_EUPCR|nr:unnamed protein product [Moneuplotes crassus]